MEKRIFYKSIIILIAPAICLFFSCSQHHEKAQFRLTGTGINLPDEWSNDKNIRWTYDIDGRGWSSPIISGNKVIITTAVNETTPPPPEIETPPPGPRQNQPNPGQQPGPRGQQQNRQGPPPQMQPDAGPRPGPGQQQGNRQGPPSPPPEDTTYKHQVYRWEVICLDLKSGKELWKQVAHKGNPRTGSGAGNGYAAETPASDGERVYAYFGMTGVFCYDMKGTLLWQKDLGAYKTQNGWGTGSSPVLFNGLLFVQVDNEAGSFIIALDAATGNEKWRAERDEKTNYSTPLIWTNKIRTEVVAGGKKVRSYDPPTGKLLWECMIGGGYSIPSSSGDNEMLYVGNAGGPDKPGNLFAIRAGASGDISLTDTTKTSNEWVAWSIPGAGTANPSPLLFKGMIYIVSSNGGNVSCFDAATGKTIYKEKIDKVGACWTSPWVYDDKIYFTDERGTTSGFKAGEKIELISQNRITDRFWSSPAISGDAYVFKGVKKVYCVGK